VYARDGIVHAVERPQEGGLATTRRANRRGDAFLINTDIQIGQRLKGAIEK
jgi:hypothetical protein